MPRPLHFLASFQSNKPIGLILAEASASDENDCSLSDEDWARWKNATKNSFPGEVFVKGWTDGGQADSLGIFEIGDRLRGVGELPFVDGGFEGAIKLVRFCFLNLGWKFRYFGLHCLKILCWTDLFFCRRLRDNPKRVGPSNFISIDFRRYGKHPPSPCWMIQSAPR